MNETLRSLKEDVHRHSARLSAIADELDQIAAEQERNETENWPVFLRIAAHVARRGDARFAQTIVASIAKSFRRWAGNWK